MHYVYLFVAIVGEVLGTSALKAADGFTRLGPTLVVVAGYAVAFYFLSLTLRTMAIGIAYALWSGIGIVLIALIGVMFYRQTLDAAAVIGLALIVAGALVLNLFSNSVQQ